MKTDNIDFKESLNFLLLKFKLLKNFKFCENLLNLIITVFLSSIKNVENITRVAPDDGVQTRRN